MAVFGTFNFYKKKETSERNTWEEIREKEIYWNIISKNIQK